MSGSGRLLPQGFEQLEPFARKWAIGSVVRRAEMRGSADAKDRRAFHAAASPLLESALAWLDARPLDQFDAADNRLMHMMLSLAHVSIGEEVQRDDEERHAGLRKRMPITHAPEGW